MGLLELFVRLIGFAFTLFMLLEFIVLCDINTHKASWCLFAISIVVIGVFILAKRVEVKRCTYCNTAVR
jgi:hypothetical protein